MDALFGVMWIDEFMNRYYWPCPEYLHGNLEGIVDAWVGWVNENDVCGKPVWVFFHCDNRQGLYKPADQVLTKDEYRTLIARFE